MLHASAILSKIFSLTLTQCIVWLPSPQRRHAVLQFFQKKVSTFWKSLCIVWLMPSIQFCLRGQLTRFWGFKKAFAVSLWCFTDLCLVWSFPHLKSSSLSVLSCFTLSHLSPAVYPSFVFACPLVTDRLEGEDCVFPAITQLQWDTHGRLTLTAVLQRSNLLRAWKNCCLSPNPAGWSVSCQCGPSPPPFQRSSFTPFSLPVLLWFHSLSPCSTTCSP